MNQKELGELRRRFRPNRNAIGRVWGCYVSPKGEVIAELDQSLTLITEDEAERYLNLLKKTMSGTPGRNLIDLEFETRQVAEGEEHRFLRDLRESKLKDEALRRAFYQKVIQSLEPGEDNYVILLAHDTYDVPFQGKDDEMQADASSQVFSYLVCAICPVKEGKAGLGYFPAERAFHNAKAGQLVSPPELGFLFPAFDDRAANLYHALYYTRKPDQIHPEFIRGVFAVEPPLSAPEQRGAFETALSDALGSQCSLEVFQAVHEQIRERLEEHKESRDPEPLTMTAGQVGGMLRECGIEEARVAAFQEYCGQQFGEDSTLDPNNIIDSKRFVITAGEITVTVKPELSGQVETRVINGRRYILIPAVDGVEINGLPVELEAEGAAAGER